MVNLKLKLDRDESTTLHAYTALKTSVFECVRKHQYTKCEIQAGTCATILRILYVHHVQIQKCQLESIGQVLLDSIAVVC